MVVACHRHIYKVYWRFRFDPRCWSFGAFWCHGKRPGVEVLADPSFLGYHRYSHVYLFLLPMISLHLWWVVNERKIGEE